MMRTALSFALVCGVIGFSLGCCPAVDPRGTRVSVQGSVTLDGKPLERARIVFRSADERNPITATGSIDSGRYVIPAERGPLVGVMRVEIEPDTVDLTEFEQARAESRGRRVSLDTVQIPPRYNQRSELTASVSGIDAENVFDFELRSR